MNFIKRFWQNLAVKIIETYLNYRAYDIRTKLSDRAVRQWHILKIRESEPYLEKEINRVIDEQNRGRTKLSSQGLKKKLNKVVKRNINNNVFKRIFGKRVFNENEYLPCTYGPRNFFKRY